MKAFVTKRHKTAFLFLLAILMLIVSCPFKRLLQSDSSLLASAQRSIKWSGADRNAAAYSNTSCCIQKQKITLIKLVVSKQEVPAPDFVAENNLQTGFAIPYFLSGTELLYAASDSSSFTSLPIFLKHRRLLI